eukprot:Skav227621  [mRNA]  locus=scaffold1141:717105:721052:- [translate_table: standard]
MAGTGQTLQQPQHPASEGRRERALVSHRHRGDSQAERAVNMAALPKTEYIGALLHESQLTELDICESLRALARVPNLNDLRAFDAAESMEADLWMFPMNRNVGHGNCYLAVRVDSSSVSTEPQAARLSSFTAQRRDPRSDSEADRRGRRKGAGKTSRSSATHGVSGCSARLVEVSGANALSPAVLRTLLWASVKTSAVGVAIGMEAVQQLADQVAAAEALRRRDFDANHLATLLWAASPGSSAGALAELLALHVPKLPENLLLRSAKAQLKLQARCCCEDSAEF